MADPKIEDGYTRIPNELLEAFIQVRISNYESRVFWLIIRKTYGFQKDSDWISQSQMSDYTGINQSHISTTIGKLKKKNIIKREGKLVSIQKDYEKWNIPKQEIKVTQTRIKKLHQQGYTKEINKYKGKKLYLDFVLLTDDEYKELVSQLGKDKTNELMEELNLYIGSTGRKYESHYFTILSWAKKGDDKRKDERIFRA